MKFRWLHGLRSVFNVPSAGGKKKMQSTNDTKEPATESRDAAHSCAARSSPTKRNNCAYMPRPVVKYTHDPVKEERTSRRQFVRADL